MKFFCVVNGERKPGVTMKFHVPAVECGIVGTWVDGKPWQPCPESFRMALPYRWRLAFDRAQGFWHVDGKAQCYVTLTDRRGKYLATVYCMPEVRK